MWQGSSLVEGPSLRFLQWADDRGLPVRPLTQSPKKVVVQKLLRNSLSDHQCWVVSDVFFQEGNAGPSIHGFKTTLPGIRVIKDYITTIVPSQSLAPVEMSIKIGCLKISKLGCTSTLYTVPLLWYYKEPFITVPSPCPHFCFGKLLFQNGSFRARNPQVKWRRRGISCTKYHKRSKEKIWPSCQSGGRACWGNCWERFGKGFTINMWPTELDWWVTIPDPTNKPMGVWTPAHIIHTKKT